MQSYVAIMALIILTAKPVFGNETEFKHMKNVQQCQMCHGPKTSHKLKLLTGELIDNSDSPKLCAQCHGMVMRDWKQGIHGKKVGSWQKSGVKLACVKCHNPHSPRFPQMKAQPPPPRPKLGIEKEKKDGER